MKKISNAFVYYANKEIKADNSRKALDDLSPFNPSLRLVGTMNDRTYSTILFTAHLVDGKALATVRAGYEEEFETLEIVSFLPACEWLQVIRVVSPDMGAHLEVLTKHVSSTPVVEISQPDLDPEVLERWESGELGKIENSVKATAPVKTVPYCIRIPAEVLDKLVDMSESSGTSDQEWVRNMLISNLPKSEE